MNFNSTIISLINPAKIVYLSLIYLTFILFTYPSIKLSNCPSIYLSVYLPIYLFTYLHIYQTIYLCNYLHNLSFAWLNLPTFNLTRVTRPSIYLATFLSINQTIDLWITFTILHMPNLSVARLNLKLYSFPKRNTK